MNDIDKELVFSEAVKAGKRIYYFDVKQSRNGDRYVSITESKKIVEGNPDNPRISYEKHKLFLYKEDYEKFVNAMLHVIDVAKTGNVPPRQEYVPAENPNPWKASKSYGQDSPVAPVAPQIVEEQATPATPEIKEESAAPEAPVVTEQPVSAPKSSDDAFKIDLDF